jgi:hypothetical protein
VSQAEEVLIVEILQLREVVLGLEGLGDLVVATGEVELVAVPGGAGNRQPGAIGRGTPHSLLQQAAGQRQPINVFGGDLGTGERLRQHTGIVGDQDRQFWQQRAIAQLGFAEAHFCGRAETAPGVGSIVAIGRDHAAADVAPLAAVERHAQQRLGIEAETDRALGESGFIAQHKTLGGFFGFRRGCRAVAVVAVEIQGAHRQCGFAVFEKTVGVVVRSLGAQGACGQHNGGGDCSVEHTGLLSDFLSLFGCFVANSGAQDPAPDG